MHFVSHFHPMTPANEDSFFEYILIMCDRKEIESAFDTSVQIEAIPNTSQSICDVELI